MYQVTAEEIKKALAEVLSQRVLLKNASSKSVMVETKFFNQYYRFSIRLNRNFKVLPTPEEVIKIYEKTGQRGDGAKWLMFGGVQIAGGRLRASARIVETETSDVRTAATGDSETSYEGLRSAFESALMKLHIGYIA